MAEIRTPDLAGANPKPLLTVCSLDQAHSTYSLSLFVTKLHLRLRHGNIPYENVLGSMGQAPKKKIPYVKFLETGELMGDSALIVERLIKEGKLEDLDKDLTPEQRAVDYCLRVMVEDRVYYLLNYERWYENYYAMRNKLYGHLPWGVKQTMGLLTFQYLKLMLYFQGTGRHNPEEVRGFMDEAIEAMAGFAERAREKAKGREGPFWILGGERPTEADFTVFGGLVGWLVNEEVQPVTARRIRGHAALVDYIERIHGRYFEDYGHLPCHVASWPGNI